MSSTKTRPTAALREMGRCLLASLALCAGASSFAASSATGRAYGLEATASVAGIGLGVPLADTALQSAPPDFDQPAGVANIGVKAGSLLSVGTGVVDTSTKSILAQNSAVSTTKVTGLGISIATTKLLGADVVTSEARMSCSSGQPVGSGSAGIAGGSGLLSGVSVSANTTIPVGVNIPLIADIGGTIYINEQSQVGNKMSVNALRIQLNLSLLGAQLLSANITVGHAEAQIADCKPTVTLAPLPLINAGNQLAVPVSGTCSAGSGNVALTSAPAGASQSLACSGSGTYQGSINTSTLPDGSVTVTAAQTASGSTSTDSQSTTKSTAAAVPVVTVGTAPLINAANQSSYGVSGTCSISGVPVDVSVGGVSASTTCSGSTWSVTGMNVTAVSDGAVTVTATQTADGQTGAGTRSTTKDATPPTVAVTSAPSITSGNQSAYVVSGSCSENGSTVSVSVGGISALPAPTCSGGAWTAPGVDTGGLPSGSVTITASQTDAAGNSGSGTRTTTKEVAQSPVTVTTAPVINAANQSSYGGVTGTCSASGGTVSVAIGGVGTTAACSSGAWSASGVNVTSLPDGTITITASQVISGSTQTGSRTTTKDSTPPSVSITTAPVIDETNQSSYSASGTCTAGDGAVTVQIGGITVTAPCNSGAWTISGVNVGGLPKGTVTITVSQTDAAGNTGSASRDVDKTTESDGSAAGTIAPQNGTWIITAELNGEPGRGMGIDVQDGMLFMQVYNYLSTGAPTFHTAVGQLKNNKVTAPLLYFTGGRYFGSAPIDARQAGSAGDVEVIFTSRTTGTIRFPGESAKPMQRYDYEGTPADVFAESALVDRWAIVELNSDNRPRNVWWADIGTGDQVRLNYDWTGSARDWPYSSETQLAIHGFDGTLASPIFASCSYSGANRLFNCTGDSVSSQNQSSAVNLTLQRSLDQLSGTLQIANAETRRIIGARITRSGYADVDGQTSRTTHFAALNAPEPGTWIISTELTGKAGRGMTMDQQKPVNSDERKLFLSVYDYQSDGDATFHSAYGGLDESSGDPLELNQYQGGRSFGSNDRVATYLDDPGSVGLRSFINPALGAIQFPGEEEVLNERYYFGVDPDSINSLLGSWVVLSDSTGGFNRIFNFVSGANGSVIDMTTGYSCVRDVLDEFSFRCTPTFAGSTDPAIRLAPAYYSASRGVIDNDDAAELTILRVRDANGQLIPSGSLFPAK